MLQETVIGISGAIQDAFGEAYQICINEITDEIQKPCFSIKMQSANQKHHIGTFYKRLQKFDIQYYPQSTGYSSEFLQITDRMFEALEYILADGTLVRATQMDTEVKEENLHFSVSYELLLTKEAETETPMEAFVMESGLKQTERKGK